MGGRSGATSSALENFFVEHLPDGRVRYYTQERFARNQNGPTRGASYVTEHNPKTGQVRSWNECYDQSGNVNRIHPKMIDGKAVQGQHYPPIGNEFNSGNRPNNNGS